MHYSHPHHYVNSLYNNKAYKRLVLKPKIARTYS